MSGETTGINGGRVPKTNGSKGAMMCLENEFKVFDEIMKMERQNDGPEGAAVSKSAVSEAAVGANYVVNLHTDMRVRERKKLQR